MRLRLNVTDLAAACVLACSVAAPCNAASAQTGWFRRDNMEFAIRPLVGSYFLTGDARNVFSSAALGGLQLSLAPTRRFAATVTFAVAPSTDRSAAPSRALDVVTLDVGAEWRLGGWQCDAGRLCAPFVGAGLGSLAYDYSDSSSGSTTYHDGYVALGGDIGFGVVAVRLEARDYLSRSSPPSNQSARQTTQNAVTIALGVGFRLGRSESPEPRKPPTVLMSRR